MGMGVRNGDSLHRIANLIIAGDLSNHTYYGYVDWSSSRSSRF